MSSSVVVVAYRIRVTPAQPEPTYRIRMRKRPEPILGPESAPVYRVRMRKCVPIVTPPPIVTQPSTQPAPLMINGRPPARRGRAPAHIPDPWSDLEWEVHSDAQAAVHSHPYGMTLEEIGSVMHITRERVRQIENTALHKLKTNTGGDITWIGSLTIATPDCRKCGEAFTRVNGRLPFCAVCDSKRRRKRRPSTLLAVPAASAAS